MKLLLDAVAASQRRGEYVSPADGAAKKIELHIQKKYHLTPACLAVEEATGSAKRLPSVFVSAIPERFVDEADSKIETMIKYLLKHKAKRFEVVFANRLAHDNAWGDKILLAARYSDK